MRKRAVQEDAVQKSFQKWSIIHYSNPNIAQFTSIHTDFIYRYKQSILIMRLLSTLIVTDESKSNTNAPK